MYVHVMFYYKLLGTCILDIVSEVLIKPSITNV